MKKIEVDELHAILLDLGKEFHRICIKHNRPYYMLGGTMLGAIRHKGIIPWDDDMDFGVPRQFYEQLKGILSKELPKQYRLLTINNSDSILTGIIKIENTKTSMKEIFKEEIPLEERIGINIDIFPLDLNNGKNSLFSKNKLIDILVKTQEYRYLSVDSRPLPQKMAALMIKGLLCFTSKTTIINFIEKLIATKGNYVANHYGAWGLRENVSKNYFGKPKLYFFNDTEFYGVENPHEYLSSLYKDYMVLPPENKRHIHILDMYWK